MSYTSKNPNNATIIKSRLDQKGGLEKYTWELARDLCRLGASVTLLTTGNIAAPFSTPCSASSAFPFRSA